MGCFTAAAVQLPPEVMVDKYLLQVTMLSEEKDYKGALEAMERVVALQKEHNLTLSEAFPFHYAQTALAAGLIRTRREGRSKLHWFEGGPLKAIAERWPISTDERAFER